MLYYVVLLSSHEKQSINIFSLINEFIWLIRYLGDRVQRLYFVKLDMEIAGAQQTRTFDQTFDIVCEDKRNI